MTDLNKKFVTFSKPFIDALKETFKVMVQTEITAHSPQIKVGDIATGELTSLIGMNGTMTDEKGELVKFRGQIAISFDMDVFLKVASSMLMDEYTEFCEDVQDAGGEIVNIVMGNAKRELSSIGYQIGMASPATLRGTGIKIKYPPQTTTVTTQISSPLGEFTFEICYQNNV